MRMITTGDTCYFSVVVIKYHDRGQLMEERLYLGFAILEG